MKMKTRKKKSFLSRRRLPPPLLCVCGRSIIIERGGGGLLIYFLLLFFYGIDATAQISHISRQKIAFEFGEFSLLLTEKCDQNKKRKKEATT
jgi:hypothetical protein